MNSEMDIKLREDFHLYADLIKRVDKNLCELNKHYDVLKCENPFSLIVLVNDIQKQKRKIEHAQFDISTIDQFLATIQTELKQIAQRFESTLAAQLAEAFQKQGVIVSGRLPEIKIGYLTLEFKPDKGKLIVWFGPKIEELACTSLHFDEIVTTVTSLLKEFSTTIDLDTFGQRLFIAFKNVSAKTSVESGQPVSVIDIYNEMVMLNQTPSFWKNPKKENFSSYSRIMFSHELSLFKQHEIDGHMLRLTIATREQTKQKMSHLWIPTNKKGDGTHFAGLLFELKRG